MTRLVVCLFTRYPGSESSIWNIRKDEKHSAHTGIIQAVLEAVAKSADQILMSEFRD